MPFISPAKHFINWVTILSQAVNPVLSTKLGKLHSLSSANHTRVAIDVKNCAFVAAEWLRRPPYCCDLAGSNPGWGRADEIPKKVETAVHLITWLNAR